MRRWLWTLALAALWSPAQAAGPARPDGVVTFEITGVAEEALPSVRSALEVYRYRQRNSIGERRLARLLQQVPAEVADALQVYGYYRARTEVEDEPLPEGRHRIHIRIDPGEPVRVSEVDLRIEGAAERNSQIAALVAGFKPALGEVFDHRVYEASKSLLERTMLRRGYLDQSLLSRRVEVDADAGTARVRLHWQSGTRYFFGPVRFEGAQFDSIQLLPYIPWGDGARFDQGRIEALQNALAATGYFELIEITPEREAIADLRVPLVVRVRPNRRNRYLAGLSYGTDDGFGIRAGLERRWVNARGHVFHGSAELAQNRSYLDAEYRLPRPGASWSQWSSSVRLGDEQTDNIDSRSLWISARADQNLPKQRQSLSINALRGSFVVGARLPDQQRRRATVLFPEWSWQRVFAEQRLRPPHGMALETKVRAASASLGSDLSLLQAEARWRVIAPAGTGARILAEVRLGATQTDEFETLPPELRFFAGGDRSVRGYGYQTLGDRDALGIAVGGRYLSTLSLEYERDFAPGFSYAVFADAGDVFSHGGPELSIGLGAGIRWFSPVGPIRLDLAHGLDSPQRSLEIHLSAGPDL